MTVIWSVALHSLKAQSRAAMRGLFRPMSVYWLVVVQAGGVIAFFQLPRDPAIVWTWIAGGLLAMILALHLPGPWQPAVSIWRYPLWAAAFLLLGYVSADLRERLVAAPKLTETQTFKQLQGRVIGIERAAKDMRILLDQLQLPNRAAEQTPDRIRLRVRQWPADLSAGDRIQITARVSPPPGPAYPGAFDFAVSAWFQRIGGVGFAFGAPQIVEPKPIQNKDLVENTRDGFDGLSAGILDIRDGIGVRLRAMLQPDSAGMATALSTGDRSGLDKTIQENLRHAGLAHLLAISGLHMGMVSGLLFFTLRALLALSQRLALWWPIKKVAAVGAMCGSFGYLLLSGGNVSTIRAFIMVVLVFTAMLLERRAISMRTVAIAAALLLVFTPEALMSPGFQMSFGAVIALIAFYEAIAASGQEFWFRRGFFILGIAATTIIAGFATAPFAMWHFQQWVNYGVFANLVAVPILSFVTMPAILLSLALMPFGAEYIMALPLDWSLSAILAIAAAVASWPHAVIITPVYPDWVFLVLSFAGLWICLESGPRRWLALAVPTMIFLFISPEPTPDLFIGKDAKNLAIRMPSGGLLLSAGNRTSFASRAWLRRAQQSHPHIPTGEEKRCDSLGCIYKSGTLTVAHSKSPSSLQDDCRLSDIVVAAYPIRTPCNGPKAIIDMADIRRAGPHSIIWRGKGSAVEQRAAGGNADTRRWKAY